MVLSVAVNLSKNIIERKKFIFSFLPGRPSHISKQPFSRLTDQEKIIINATANGANIKFPRRWSDIVSHCVTRRIVSFIENSPSLPSLIKYPNDMRYIIVVIANKVDRKIILKHPTQILRTRLRLTGSNNGFGVFGNLKDRQTLIIQWKTILKEN